MRNIVLLLLSLTTALPLIAQKKPKPEEAIYALDSNFQGTTLEKAQYIVHSVKKSDTCWRFNTYAIFGPMLTSEDYKDNKAQVLHGQVVYFNKAGTRDSIGHFENGLAHGSFYYLNDTGRIYMQKEFSKGLLLQTIDRIRQDSIDKAEEKKKADTSVTVTEVESDFPGGLKGWIKYLTKNMVYPERAQKLIKEGQVWIQFIVDKDGTVYDQEIIKSVEFSLDQEAMRIITASPAWMPAVQNGRKVKSYKKQPITFRLQ